MSVVAERTRELRFLRDRMMETGDLPDTRQVRPDIVRSWQRCVANGIVPDRVHPEYVPDRDGEDLLRATAAPVFARLCDQLASMSTNVMLADSYGVILEHWTDDQRLRRLLERSNSAPGFVMRETVVGNNGMGTVLEEQRPAWVYGAEHFADDWLPFTCVGVPIEHPVTGRIEGVLNIACRADDANGLMLPVALGAAREIERRLYLGRSHTERLLMEKFLSASQSGRAVIVLNDQMLISNAPAAGVLDHAGQAVLWDHAVAAISGHHQRRSELKLAPGQVVTTRCHPIAKDDDLIGALIEIEPSARALEAPAAFVSPGPGRAARESSHWVWQRLRERGCALRDAGLPLLLVGAPGAGKLTLAAEMFPDACRRGLMFVHDAARQPVEGTSTWVSHVMSSLSRPDGVVVVRGIQALDAPAVRAVCSVVDALPPAAPYLVATANLDQVTTVHRPLIDRLAAGTVQVPALRERIEELPRLLAILTEKYAADPGRLRWQPEAIQVLSRFDWPGNVRQLENLVRRVLVTSDHRDVHPHDLPEEIRAQATRRHLSQLERVERQAIVDALRRSAGNKSEAAEFLGISRATLYRKLRSFRIDTSRSACLTLA